MEEKNNEGAEEFVKDYGALVEKHGYDFANYPMYVPDGQGGFKTIIQSVPVKRPNSIKSPFVTPES